MMHHHHDSLLFAPPIQIEDYVYVDPGSCPFPSSEVLLDGSWMASSCSSEVLEYQGSDPVEVVFDTMSTVEDELLSPLFPDKGQEWADSSMVGVPVDGFPSDEEQQHPSLSPFHQTHYNLPIGGFHGDIYYPTPLDVAAAATLDVNNQNYCGYAGDDHGFGNVY
jgi:hypothetical protein